MNKKALIEKKNSLLDEMEQLLEAAATETRALISDEEKVYKEKKARCRDCRPQSPKSMRQSAAPLKRAKRQNAARPKRRSRQKSARSVILFSDARTSFVPVSRTFRWATTRLLSRPRS